VLGVFMKKRELLLSQKGKGKEKIDLYLKAAKKYNIEICLLRWSDINKQSGIALAHYKKKNNWTVRRIPIPKVK